MAISLGQKYWTMTPYHLWKEEKVTQNVFFQMADRRFGFSPLELVDVNLIKFCSNYFLTVDVNLIEIVHLKDFVVRGWCRGIKVMINRGCPQFYFSQSSAQKVVRKKLVNFSWLHNHELFILHNHELFILHRGQLERK